MKEKFLKELKDSLIAMNVEESLLRETLVLYENYIDNEINKHNESQIEINSDIDLSDSIINLLEKPNIIALNTKKEGKSKIYFRGENIVLDNYEVVTDPIPEKEDFQISNVDNMASENKSYSEVHQENNTKKEDLHKVDNRSTFSIVAIIVFFLFLDLIVVIPVGLSILLTLVALMIIPVAFSIISWATLVSGVLYINNYPLVLNAITRYTLPIAIFLLSLLAFIVLIYLISKFTKIFFKIFALQNKVIRRVR